MEPTKAIIYCQPSFEFDQMIADNFFFDFFFKNDFLEEHEDCTPESWPAC